MTVVNSHNRSDAIVRFVAEPGDSDLREQVIANIPFLRAFARGLCGQRDEADDLCQRALTKAWKSRATFLPGTNLKVWLFAKLRDQFFSEKRPSFRLRPWGNTVADKSLVNGAALHAAPTRCDIAGALQYLSYEQREALILVGPGGFSYKDAARISGCALGTVKSRVARAGRALDATITCTMPLSKAQIGKLIGTGRFTVA